AAAELKGVEVVPEQLGYSVYMSVPPERVAALDGRRRNMAARTGCGLCGAETIAQAIRAAARVGAGLPLGPAAIARARGQLPENPGPAAQRGAVRGAGRTSPDGGRVLVRADVGRHAALDKSTGALTVAGIAPGRGFAVVTSRARYELV